MIVWKCGVVVRGRDSAEATRRWNRRSPAQDHKKNTTPFEVTPVFANDRDDLAQLRAAVGKLSLQVEKPLVAFVNFYEHRMPEAFRTFQEAEDQAAFLVSDCQRKRVACVMVVAREGQFDDE